MARPAIPASPIWPNVLPGPTSAAAATAEVGPGSIGDASATGRTAGDVTVQLGGTDNAPTVLAWPRPAVTVGADHPVGLMFVIVAGKSVGGTAAVPGQGSTPAQPLTKSSVC